MTSPRHNERRNEILQEMAKLSEELKTLDQRDFNDSNDQKIRMLNLYWLHFNPLSNMSVKLAPANTKFLYNCAATENNPNFNALENLGNRLNIEGLDPIVLIDYNDHVLYYTPQDVRYDDGKSYQAAANTGFLSLHTEMQELTKLVGYIRNSHMQSNQDIYELEKRIERLEHTARMRENQDK